EGQRKRAQHVEAHALVMTRRGEPFEVRILDHAIPQAMLHAPGQHVLQQRDARLGQIHLAQGLWPMRECGAAGVHPVQPHLLGARVPRRPALGSAWRRPRAGPRRAPAAPARSPRTRTSAYVCMSSSRPRLITADLCPPPGTNPARSSTRIAAGLPSYTLACTRTRSKACIAAGTKAASTAVMTPRFQCLCASQYPSSADSRCTSVPGCRLTPPTALPSISIAHARSDSS